MQPTVAEYDKKEASSSSSSSSYKTVNSSPSLTESDAQLSLLSRLEALQVLLLDIKPTEEPIVPQQPDVLRIQYSSTFNYVLGMYRTMSATFTGVHSPSSAKWFLLTAYVLRQCTSHYSVWKDRRDVLLEPARLLSSTQESLKEENDKIDNTRMFLQEVMPVAERWLPMRADVEGPGGAYSPWRAVQWELNVMKSFNMRFHKNFQVWHHRKELLIESLARTDPALRQEAFASLESFDRYLSTHHNVRFADIDERTLCNEVLEIDVKNYHVWLHRSWFVHAFSFLLQPPLWAALLKHFGISAQKRETSGSDLPPFIPNSKWKRECMKPTVPPCSLNDELMYTASLIRADCFNNSAWCHRFLVFRNDLIGVLLRNNAPIHPTDVEEVVRQFCLEEMNYALQWCFYEPCNESSFVHARSVAAVFQAATIRLHLSNNAGKAHSCLNDSEPIFNDSRSSSHYTCLSDKVSWNDFLATFSLLLQQLCALRDVITPRAEDFRVYGTARDAKTVHVIHQCRSQFLLDNVHQVYAAHYHCLFLLLEHLWCYYFTDDERSRVKKALPSEVYAAGIDAVETQVAQVPDGCIKFFLENEMRAMELARRLVTEDSIRSRYWKHEISLVMHREYNQEEAERACV
ncbi:protein farnesyltransferase alpha subunit [Trypanosoma grayi]|uniref:protein farnesyltransferase alpha subunit n=1 Tax=Trypanosoma grayi TaxID=71804 RepID=UPI0004F44D88|nr:protein farnesyltransferase alpha subunit [Trypanosoma grayi]KEG11312.1 protein farnesyltransferase alpha subunit [Trypanosoma grayi]